jgi:C-terminal processing protease CtpA/Prc
MAGSPAAAADLQSWEVIEQVDGVYTRGRPLWTLRVELRDKEAAGDSVTLTIIDRSVDERREVVLEPLEWAPTTATSEDVEGTTVLTVDSLPDGAADRIVELVPGDRPLVIDIRGLVWGHEREAIAVADLFVEEGPLAGWQGRKAGSQSYNATEGSLVTDRPVVLVGPDTEGVGEILAAALQRAGSRLVGSRTIGHAPHMRFIQEGEISLWLPVGTWMRSDDVTINGNGIEPEEVVPEPDGESDEASDPVLERALELVGEPLEQAA